MYICVVIWTISRRDILSKLTPLQWRHNQSDSVWYHRCLYCLLIRLIRRISKKASKLHVTGLCDGIHRWPVVSPRKKNSNTNIVSIWWPHHGIFDVSRMKKHSQMQLNNRWAHFSRFSANHVFTACQEKTSIVYPTYECNHGGWWLCCFFQGGRLNTKMTFCEYRNPHYSEQSFIYIIEIGSSYSYTFLVTRNSITTRECIYGYPVSLIR